MEKAQSSCGASKTLKGIISGGPKSRTGKPKGSGEGYIPMRTKRHVSIKFATKSDTDKFAVKKIKNRLRKIQILTVGEQRAKVMGKNEIAIFKKVKESIRKSRKTCVS